MKLTEAIINQINEVPKLRYLLVNLVQKQEDTSSQNKQLKKKLSNLESKYNAVKKDYDTLVDNSEYTQLHQSDIEFERIRADFNQKACEFFVKIINNISITDAVSEATEIVNEFKSELNFTIQAQRDKVNQTLSQQNKLIQEKTMLIEDLKEKADKPISDDVEKLINDKDEAISQLKEMLQRSVKSDQRNQEQIQTLQQQNKELTELLSSKGDNSKNKNTTDMPVETITKLEMQISELEQRLANSSASKELEIKNERLQMMLEKSNKLYSQLDERYQLLEKNVTQKQFYAIVQESFCFEIPSQNDSLPNSNSSQLIKSSSSSSFTTTSKKEEKRKRIEYEAMVASLRKTLLQYFLCTNDNQEELVPVILEIVGCTQEQVYTVTRNLETRKHLINKTGKLFGLFG